MPFANNLLNIFLMFCCSKTVWAQLKSSVPGTDNNNTAEWNQNRLNPRGLALLNQKECGVRVHTGNSFGGNDENAKLAEFPWIALLRYEDINLSNLYVGSLINHRYVLTAAHCLFNNYDELTKLIGVRLGEYDTESNLDCQYIASKFTCMPPYEDIGVEKTIPHPHYSRQPVSNDVGLIRLNRNVEFKDHIKPICLPTTLMSTKPIVPKYIITGWGLKRDFESKELLKTEVELVSRSDCQKSYPIHNIMKSLTCAGSKSYSCHGDLGGPLVSQAKIVGESRFVQFGILSFGMIDCMDHPDVFTNTINVLPWITNNIEQYEKENTTASITQAIAKRPSSNEEYQSRFNPRGLALLNQNECGLRSYTRISNGQRTRVAEFPWMALLRYQDSSRPYQCGGSLITNRYILTAAHCINNELEKPIEVRLGEYNTNSFLDCEYIASKFTCMPPYEDIGIEELIPHPAYSKITISNDVGLIRLNRTVRYKVHIKPICLPTTLISAKPIEPKYTIAGWGLTESNVVANVLLKAELRHKSRSFCQNKFVQHNINEQHICAEGKSGSDSCYGDSGGPLMAQAELDGRPQQVQFGIISFGVLVCSRNITHPGIYANIIENLPWITDNIT